MSDKTSSAELAQAVRDEVEALNTALANARYSGVRVVLVLKAYRGTGDVMNLTVKSIRSTEEL